jgi:hypothetical protein
MILWLWLIPVAVAAVIVIWALFSVVKRTAGQRTDGQILVDRSVDER